MRWVEIRVAHLSVGISTEFIAAPGMCKVVAVVAHIAIRHDGNSGPHFVSRFPEMRTVGTLMRAIFRSEPLPPNDNKPFPSYKDTPVPPHPPLKAASSSTHSTDPSFSLSTRACFGGIHVHRIMSCMKYLLEAHF